MQTIGDAALAEEIGGRRDHVLFDARQPPSGDPDWVEAGRASYSFHGATLRNILDFPKEFSPRADGFTLDRNFRSTTVILAAANGLIGLARKRFKNLWTEQEFADRAVLSGQPSSGGLKVELIRC